MFDGYFVWKGEINVKDLSILPVNRLLAATVVGVSVGLMTSGMAVAQSGPDPSTLDMSTAQGQESRAIAEAMSRKTGAMSKVGIDLGNLYREHETFALRRAFRAPAGGFESSNPMIQMVGGMVVIDAVAAEDAEALLRDLEALGLVKGSRFGHVVSGQLPVAALEALAGLESLQFARPAMAMAQIGSVTSQGDAAMNADEAREEEKVRGRRVTVGVLSDSYDSTLR